MFNTLLKWFGYRKKVSISLTMEDYNALLHCLNSGRGGSGASRLFGKNGLERDDSLIFHAKGVTIKINFIK